MAKEARFEKAMRRANALASETTRAIVELMRAFPPCANCAHYEGDQRCRAFRNRIPGVIWNAEHNHRTAVPGDHGILFEPMNPQLDANSPRSKGDAVH